jgi:Bacterial mobilisation protein (MobC)
MEPVKKGTKKSGRPKKAVVRTRTTGIRFSTLEHFIVREKARTAGLNLTTYIRQAAVEAKVQTRLTAEEQLLVRQLVGFSNNINQIARACHQEGVLKALLYFENFRIQIDQLLKNLKI